MPKIIKPMFDILLQIDTTKVVEKIQGFESVGGTLLQGGWLMVPLGLLFVIALFFFFERLLTLNKASKIEDNFMNIIRDQIISGNITAARSLAKNTPNPVAKMIDKGIQRIGKPIEAIEKSMENVGVLEMYSMEKNLNILNVIVRIAPLFGFLGTIVGMLSLFDSINRSTEYNANVIAGGIYVKMITSATGLMIGIITYLGLSYLQTRIRKIENKMEAASAEFIDILQEPTR
ncbi:MAG: MotA/TolQ/ExbB proton channel family protein [Bacteroidota bacterium]